MAELTGHRLSKSALLLPGFVVLKRRGQVVWIGPISALIEDAECDEMVLHSADFDRVLAATKGGDNG